MKTPFANRTPGLSDPTRDIAPVVPDDAAVLSVAGQALYVETGGMVRLVTEAGETRSLRVGDFALLPVGVRQVLSTGTTAAGLHVLVNP